MPSHVADRSKHEAMVAQLSEYLDGALPRRQQEALERHLGACASCRHELDTLRATVELLRQTPRQSVPHSFVLPASAQASQTRYLRWNAAFSFLRLSTVVASFMLLVLVSSDVLFGSGLIPLAQRPAASSAQRTVWQSAATVPAPVQEVENPASAAEAVPTKPAVEAEKVVEKLAPKGGVVERSPTPLPTLRMSTPAAPAAAGSGTVAVVPRVSGALPAMPQRSPATETVPPAAPEKAVPAPLVLAPTATPPILPTPSAAREQKVVEPVASEAQPGPAETVYDPPPLDSAWSIWRSVRILSVLLAGLVLVLLGGTIFVGSRRRID